jgi:hypothetical protein
MKCDQTNYTRRPSQNDTTAVATTPTEATTTIPDIYM